jgi:hypothetical protein
MVRLKIIEWSTWCGKADHLMVSDKQREEKKWSGPNIPFKGIPNEIKFFH